MDITFTNFGKMTFRTTIWWLKGPATVWQEIDGQYLVLRTSVDEHFRAKKKKGCIYWFHVGFEKALDSTNREALSCKMSKNRGKWEHGRLYKNHVSRYRILCNMYKQPNIQLCHTITGEKQGCSFESPTT